MALRLDDTHAPLIILLLRPTPAALGMAQSAWSSTLQHGSPDEYRAALRAEYSRLLELRKGELATASAPDAHGQGRVRVVPHDEHGGGPHTAGKSARPGGWKARHTNDVPDSSISGMTEEEKFT